MHISKPFNYFTLKQSFFNDFIDIIQCNLYIQYPLRIDSYQRTHLAKTMASAWHSVQYLLIFTGHFYIRIQTKFLCQKFYFRMYIQRATGDAACTGADKHLGSDTPFLISQIALQ